jgi:PiT family inorganic phosphate transporter
VTLDKPFEKRTPMMILFFLFVVTLFLAYSNGANDNFKGVATLFGSKTTNYRLALTLATVTTFAGSVASVFLAQTLVQNFSGNGLGPDALNSSPEFLIAVAAGAGVTVILATILGFPISTTHGLAGALTGAGLVAAGAHIDLARLGGNVFLPLIVSPLAALILSALAYVVFRQIRLWMGVREEHCICVRNEERVVTAPQPAWALQFYSIALPVIGVGNVTSCDRRYGGRIFGLSVQSVLDLAHVVSASIVSFARGLNDTPKIVALVLAVELLRIEWGILAVASAMAVGGMLNARKVALTMSEKITGMNHGQGFTANLITGVLVIVASRFGMPVSTTHVSVGAITGIGAVSRQVNRRVIRDVAASWVLTLPVAAISAGTILFLIHWMN